MTELRVGLVLCSSSAQPIPSTRIAVLNMLPFFLSAGLQPRVLFEPLQPSETPDLTAVAALAINAGCDVVLLQKVRGLGAVALAHQLRAAGVRTVYIVCDLVDVPMVEATDATVVVTEYLRSLYPQRLMPRIHVVHDGIEQPAAGKVDWGSATGARHCPLKAVLVTSACLERLPVLGHPPAWLNVRIVGRYTRGLRKWREMRWTWATQSAAERLEHVRFLLDRRIECVPWDPEGVYREMMQADIAVIPVEAVVSKTGANVPLAWQVKSENRLTMKMSMGLPVIATPIPSYETVIEHGVNGFFARSTRDWEACLSFLRDPARRREMGLAARASVMKTYSMQAQAAKLISVLREVCATPP